MAIENAVEGAVQHGLGALPRYLIINFAPQMFNSNLFRYIVENLRQGDPFFWHVRFSEWVRTLFQQAIVNGNANEPMFPDPGEVPPAQIDAVQAGQQFLEYYEGLRNTDQAVIDAVRRFLGTAVEQTAQNIEQVEPVPQDEPMGQPRQQPQRESVPISTSEMITNNIAAFRRKFPDGPSQNSMALAQALNLAETQVMRSLGDMIATSTQLRNVRNALTSTATRRTAAASITAYINTYRGRLDMLAPDFVTFLTSIVNELRRSG